MCNSSTNHLATFFTMVIILSRFQFVNKITPWSCQNTNKIRFFFISIWDPRIPRICLARNPTFSSVCHQARISTHLDKRIDLSKLKQLFSNKCTCEDFLMNVPTPNMLVSFSSTSTICPLSPLYRHCLDSKV